MPAIPDNTWYKSRRSSGASNCVEVAHGHGWTAVHDSKNKTGPIITVTNSEWNTFITAVRAVEFDHYQ
jgi:hypothetical protein